MKKAGKTGKQDGGRFVTVTKGIRRNLGVYGLIAPFFLLFLVFMIIPVCISLPMGFTDFNMAQFPRWVGLDNFFTLFLEDEVFIRALENTLIFAVITGPVSYILCFLLAWLIYELPGPLKTIFTFI
ncbi:MAG: sugar ABC transporter permease, partial [Ruminiclostridium sp.]|nr:sugar ABC transporter permease [Ruminiclostridium sp.]